MSDDSTRPISVAELLARNGTIGSPPVGGHRRRKRRNAVSVADLTGEIPVVRTGELPVVIEDEPAGDEESVPAAEYSVSESADTVVVYVSTPEADTPEYTDYTDTPDYTPEYTYTTAVVVEANQVSEEAEIAEYDEIVEEADFLEEADVLEEAGVVEEADVLEEAHLLEEADVLEDAGVVEEAELSDEGHDLDIGHVENIDVIEEAEPDQSSVIEYTEVSAPQAVISAPPRSAIPLPRRRRGPERSHDPRPRRRSSGAEQMAYDPVDEAVDLADLVGEQVPDAEELRSYLRSSTGTLFSGETVADDLARRGLVSESDAVYRDEDYDDEDYESADVVGAARPGALSVVGNSVVAIIQSLLAVVFGAGLFIAFDQLWRWNNIVALALSTLVIVALVVGVHVVRKTEDFVSILIAVAVGILVTFGPLALQST